MIDWLVLPMYWRCICCIVSYKRDWKKSNLVPRAYSKPFPANISVTTEAPGGGGLVCGVWTWSVCQVVLQRRYDIRGREVNVFRHCCEEGRFLEITWRIFGRAGLTAFTNGILWGSFLVISPSTCKPRILSGSKFPSNITPFRPFRGFGFVLLYNVYKKA